jgi:thiol-disulfide isomerase/thioredoxin
LLSTLSTRTTAVEIFDTAMKLQQRDRSPKKESSTIKRWTTTPCLFVAVLVVSLSLLHCLNEFTSPKKSKSAGVNIMSKFQIQNLTVENSTRPERFPTNFFNFPMIRADEFDSMYSLTPETFAYLNATQIPQITVFFSPWCHHCQTFIPQFLEVALKYLKDVNATSVSGIQRKGPVVFGTINCVNLRDVCMKQTIQFYPSVVVKWFPKGMYISPASCLTLPSAEKQICDP